MAPISEGALRPAQRSGSVLACVSVCTALVVGFVAAINLAVPQLAASSLRPTSSNLLWIVDAYVVIFACLVIPAGAVGDKLGRKGVLMAGLGIFAFGAIVSAIAPNVAIMLIGRAITGLGAACVLPNCVGILLHTTAPERRSHALAIWAAATGIGGVVGNVGGGAVLSAGSWRALFAAVAFVAACCLAWAARSAPRSARHDRTLDLPGTLLFVAAFVALLIGIIEGPEQGWGSTVVLIAFACSLLLILCWVLVELRAPHPMLDPRLFRSAALSSSRPRHDHHILRKLRALLRQRLTPAIRAWLLRPAGRPRGHPADRPAPGGHPLRSRAHPQHRHPHDTLRGLRAHQRRPARPLVRLDHGLPRVRGRSVRHRARHHAGRALSDRSDRFGPARGEGGHRRRAAVRDPRTGQRSGCGRGRHHPHSRVHTPPACRTGPATRRSRVRCRKHSRWPRPTTPSSPKRSSTAPTPRCAPRPSSCSWPEPWSSCGARRAQRTAPR